MAASERTAGEWGEHWGQSPQKLCEGGHHETKDPQNQ